MRPFETELLRSGVKYLRYHRDLSREILAELDYTMFQEEIDHAAKQQSVPESDIEQFRKNWLVQIAEQRATDWISKNGVPK